MKKTVEGNKTGATRQEPHNNGATKKPDFEPPPRSDGTSAAPPEGEDCYYEEVDLETTDGLYDDDEGEETEADKFPLEALEPFLNLLRPIRDWMRQLEMPALLPVVCALLVLSMALGRGLRVRNKKGLTYPNLFAMLSAHTGTGKTLVYDAATSPLLELQKELSAEFEHEAGLLKASAGMVKKEIEAILANFAKLKKGGKALKAEEEENTKKKLAALYQEQEKIEDKLAKPPAIWTSDFTAEALAMRLVSSGEVLAVLSDEGGIAVQCMEGRYSEGDMSDDMLLCKGFSVNAHVQDRVGRGRIVLEEPCIALLLLVQPDILRRAFRNIRLATGGFLARCLCAETNLKMQLEDENAEDTEFDAETTTAWSGFIKSIYRKYHGAAAFDLKVNPGVRKLSQRLHNWIVVQLRGRFEGVHDFAARWREIAWKMSVGLHAALYGTESEHHPLEESTFEAASTLVRYFAELQFEVLAEMREAQIEKTHAKLMTIFLKRGQKPITVREAVRNYRITRAQLFACVKACPETFGMLRKTLHRGGSPSIMVFLKQFPPKNTPV